MPKNLTIGLNHAKMNDRVISIVADAPKLDKVITGELDVYDADEQSETASQELERER